MHISIHPLHFKPVPVLYLNSDEFKKAYEQDRRSAKPAEPVFKPIRTKAEIQKEEITRTEKSIRDFEKNMKSLDAATQKNMLPVLDIFKKKPERIPGPQ